MIKMGETTDGKTVVAGVFTLMSTHGLPLEFILEELKSRGLVTDWVDFVVKARADGWKDRTIVTRVEAAVGDVFGATYRKGFMDRMNVLLGAK